MSQNAIYRWHGSELHLLDYCDMTDASIEAADSWFVTAGTVLALDLHRRRFLDALDAQGFTSDAHPDLEAEAFWNAAIAAIPRDGDWFPRVELQSRGGAPLLVLRMRSAPERHLTAAVISHDGDDPRHAPSIKGPSLDALLRIRTTAQARGADDVIILSELGHIVEGTTSAVLWWRGTVLCTPAPELERVDSVTARSVIALATALGIDILWEATEPAELDGLEVWLASALHGLRIVTQWIDGPALAEEPGRLRTWRARLDSLRRALPALDDDRLAK